MPWRRNRPFRPRGLGVILPGCPDYENRQGAGGSNPTSSASEVAGFLLRFVEISAVVGVFRNQGQLEMGAKRARIGFVGDSSPQPPWRSLLLGLAPFVVEKRTGALRSDWCQLTLLGCPVERQVCARERFEVEFGWLKALGDRSDDGRSQKGER